jgi:hypothetical protein
MKKILSFKNSLWFFVTIIFTSVNTQVAKAQFDESGNISMEAGLNVGLMNCLTDVGGKPGVGGKFTKDLIWANTHMAYGAYFVASYRNTIGLRLDATFGKVSAVDNPDNIKYDKPWTDFTQIRQNRNLSFQSKINEITLMAEFHPFGIIPAFINEEGTEPPVSPYLMGGIGFYSFNPQAENKFGDMVDLQPLSTEGQGFSEYPDRKIYNLKQINLPMGIGVKFNISNAIRIRTEFVHRKLLTDYLDDVSTTYINTSAYRSNGFSDTQYFDALEMNNREIVKYSVPGSKRGNPDNKDSYFTFNLKIGVNIAALMGSGYAY